MVLEDHHLLRVDELALHEISLVGDDSVETPKYVDLRQDFLEVGEKNKMVRGCIRFRIFFFFGLSLPGFYQIFRVLAFAQTFDHRTSEVDVSEGEGGVTEVIRLRHIPGLEESVSLLEIFLEFQSRFLHQLV